MADIIRAYGLFWRADDAFWGSGASKGRLLGVPVRGRQSEPVDFRDQVGIYVLYAGHRMTYVGQTGSGSQKLLRRLRTHRRDKLAGRWDHFSWFGLRQVLASGRLAVINQKARSPLPVTLNQMEAILIAAAEPELNRQGGRFGRNAVRYLQMRDERLGLTQAQMIRDIWKTLRKMKPRAPSRSGERPS